MKKCVSFLVFYVRRVKKDGERLNKLIGIKRLGWLIIWVSCNAIASLPMVSDSHTQISMAPNEVVLINIATPNAAGISHNIYSAFDIPDQGAILNNAYDAIQTQLAGKIAANPNLTGPAAALIINEVNHGNPSQLRGVLEVAGHAASVVVANPWGIYCNRCGFINTPYAMLVTGRPLFDAKGNIKRYYVEGGQITFTGAGADVKNVDYMTIMTRSLRVNAALYANRLQLLLGTNEMEADTGAISVIMATEPSIPQYALDVSILGGMYANKINLIGTEEGVGVNYKGTLSVPEGAVVIDHFGSVTFGGKIEVGVLKTIVPEGIKTLIQNTGTIKASQGMYLQGTIIKNAEKGNIEVGQLDVVASRFSNSGQYKVFTRADINTEWFSNIKDAKMEINQLYLNAQDLLHMGQLEIGEYADIHITKYFSFLGAMRGKKEIHLHAYQGGESRRHLSAPILTIEAEPRWGNSGVLKSERLTIKTSHFSNSVFGKIEVDRLDLRTKSLTNDGHFSLSSYAEIRTNNLFLGSVIESTDILKIYISEGYVNKRNQIKAKTLEIIPGSS